MRVRILGYLFSAAVLVALPACTGNASEVDLTRQRCSDAGQRFCLVACNLGCSGSGLCQVTEIASVSAGSVSLRTINGQSPVGQFTTQGSSLVFVPSARIVNGQTVFGFLASETYILSIPGNQADRKSVV